MKTIKEIEDFHRDLYPSIGTVKSVDRGGIYVLFTNSTCSLTIDEPDLYIRAEASVHYQRKKIFGRITYGDAAGTAALTLSGDPTIVQLHKGELYYAALKLVVDSLRRYYSITNNNVQLGGLQLGTI